MFSVNIVIACQFYEVRCACEYVFIANFNDGRFIAMFLYSFSFFYFVFFSVFLQQCESTFWFGQLEKWILFLLHRFIHKFVLVQRKMWDVHVCVCFIKEGKKEKRMIFYKITNYEYVFIIEKFCIQLNLLLNWMQSFFSIWLLQTIGLGASRVFREIIKWDKKNHLLND